jgi:hypothetical protein
VRGIAGKDHPALVESPSAGTGTCRSSSIRARSLISSPSIALQPRSMFSGLSSSAVDVPAELEIDPPDIVGLLVQKRRLAAVERRVEPEPAFGRKFASITTSAIRKLSSNTRPTKSSSQHGGSATPLRRRRSAKSASSSVGPVRRADRQFGTFGSWVDRDDLVAAAQLNRLALGLQLAHPVNQVLLDVILLQVDEGRTPVPFFGQQVELEDLAFVKKTLPRFQT